MRLVASANEAATRRTVHTSHAYTPSHAASNSREIGRAPPATVIYDVSVPTLMTVAQRRRPLFALAWILVAAGGAFAACGGDAQGVGAGALPDGGVGTGDGAPGDGSSSGDGHQGQDDGGASVDGDVGDGADDGSGGGDGSALGDGGSDDGSAGGDGSTSGDASLGLDGSGNDGATTSDGSGTSDGSASDGAAIDAGPPKNPIDGENQQPGTTEWMLTTPAKAREIEGYASTTSLAAGESLSLYVNTASAKYTMSVYRLGYYGGQGGRAMTAPVELDGHVQATPSPDADGLVECNWVSPTTVNVPANWVTGQYVIKLTTKDTGKQSYVPFVVRDDTRASKYLFQSSVTTFQAYNNWGGKSLYDFNSQGGTRASRVSFLRPYALGENPEAAVGVGAGELITNLQGASHTGPTGWEYPMIRFLEREGYDVSYVTNIDVHRDAALVAKHRVFLSVGHDEYWTHEMRNHVEFARDHDGTSLAFFSGNVSYWQARLGAAKGGAPNATLTCFKDTVTDPFFGTADAHQTTVRFGSGTLARSEAGLAGVAFQDYDINADLVVEGASSWLFAGTGLVKGSHLTGLVGYEVDGVGEPPLPGVRPVTRSPWTTPRATSGSSEMAVRHLPSHAETFAAGSIQFPWGLDDQRLPGVTQPNVASAAAQQMTRNILDRLALPRPGVDRSPVLLDDSFGGTIDLDRWSLRTINEGYAAFDPLVTVATAAGRLSITPRAGVSGLHHGGVVSARTYAMTCGSAKVELVQATSSASSADTTFAVVVDPSHWLRMTVESGALVMGVNTGTPSTTQIAYDAVQHRHLRLRHDCVANQIRFETSPDASAWTVRRSVSPIELRAAYIELEAGTYQAEAAPGQALFDDLHVETTGVREDFATQRDPEVLTPDAIHEGGFDRLIPIFVHGGALHLRPRGGVAGQHHAGFATTREIDWTGGASGLTVLAAPNTSAEGSVSLAVVPQGVGYVRVAVSAGKIFFQAKDTNSVTSSTSLTFDPTTHRHVRIRHEAGPDEIVWETSTNGSSWIERRRAARPIPVTAARAEVEGGTYQVETAPGEAIVDDFFFAK